MKMLGESLPGGVQTWVLLPNQHANICQKPARRGLTRIARQFRTDLRTTLLEDSRGRASPRLLRFGDRFLLPGCGLATIGLSVVRDYQFANERVEYQGHQFNPGVDSDFGKNIPEMSSNRCG